MEDVDEEEENEEEKKEKGMNEETIKSRLKKKTGVKK